MKKLYFILCVMMAFCITANAQVITTIAGDSTQGYSGDGGAATAAELFYPHGVAVDGSSNFYIADSYNGRIRKVNTSGLIATIAGNGAASYSGDGGAATTAALKYPRGVAVDGSGNIYIADLTNNRIRKVDTGGVITTIAGNGYGAGTGIGGYSGDGGAATAAELSLPTGVAVDVGGNVYIADEHNNRVRKVNTSGVITTIAGCGTAGYGGDGGAATAAELSEPWGVAVDGSGNVYIADLTNNRIRKVDTGGVITTIAGIGAAGYSGDGGTATAAELSSPTGVAVDGTGNIYVVDAGNQRIRKVDISGVITTIAGNGILGYSGDGGAATAAELNLPAGVAVDGSGDVYIADTYNNIVRKVSSTTAAALLPLPQPALGIYPNPNTGSFAIRLSSQADENAKITITNLIGEKLLEMNMPTNKTAEISTGMQSGIYFVAATTAHGRWVEKVVIK